MAVPSRNQRRIHLKNRTHLFRIALQFLAATLVFAAVQAGAQPAYPTKVILLVNPNQPGGNSDIIFRLLSGRMDETLGQQIVFDYRPGAGG